MSKFLDKIQSKYEAKNKAALRKKIGVHANTEEEVLEDESQGHHNSSSVSLVDSVDSFWFHLTDLGPEKMAQEFKKYADAHQDIDDEKLHQLDLNFLGLTKELMNLKRD